MSSRVEILLKRLFYNIGIQTYHHPYKFMLSGFLLTIVSAVGFLNLKWNNEIWYIWIPRHSSIFQNFDTFNHYFGEAPKSMQLLFKDTNEDNLLTPSKMDLMYDVYQMNMNSSIISIESSSKENGNSSRLSFNDLCSKLYSSDGFCDSYTGNIFALFNYNDPSYWSTQESIDSIIENYGESIQFFAGGLKYDSDNNNNNNNNSEQELVGASYVQLYYTLEGSSKNTIKSEEESLCDKFENYWNKHESDSIYKENNISMTYFTSFSLDTEIDKVTSMDADKFGYAFTAMLIILSMILGKKMTCIELKVLLAFASLLITGCALVIGCGIGCALGFEFNSIILLVPFILLGIGIDDDLSCVEYNQFFFFSLWLLLFRTDLNCVVVSQNTAVCVM